jgi:hypothetical protein
VFNPIPDGSSIILEGITCYIPPFGIGCHSETGVLKPTDIIKRSSRKEEQYWERTLLPKDFEKKALIEKKKDEEIKAAEKRAAEAANRLVEDVGYSDPDLDAFRIQEWHRRMYGVWFWNNGVPVYITGLHYFYLNYWHLDSGYPDFRIIDLEKAYVWQVVVEDPKAVGMIEVRKRRDGKSFFAGCMLFESLSRTKGTIEGGIISYNKDSASEFFSKTMVSPFKRLASFFVPVWDTSSTLKSDITFTQPSIKGRNNNIHNNGQELGSYLTFMDSKPKAYDGHKLKRLVVDEVFKTEVDCFKRHLTVKYCATDHTGAITGKILYTSTVEEIGVKFKGDKFWAQNDQLRRLPVSDSVVRGGELYCFFMPAYRSGKYDKYGYCDESKEKQRIKDSQRQYEDSESDLIADMRKNPFDVIQAFRITSNTCHFPQSKLHERIDEIGWTNIVSRGDLVWNNSEPLTKVNFIPNKNSGKFYICTGFKFEDEKDANNVMKRGNSYQPANTAKYVMGLDPYDHDITEDNRKSNAAFYVFKKHNPMKPNDPYNRAFVMEYVYRPATAALMYDDVLKACFYFGCQLLFESNKPGVRTYFRDKGCGSFLIQLDDYKDAGIPANPANKQAGVDLIEEYINENLDKVYFKRLIQSWIKFNINDTQKEDETMASMWTLWADKYKIIKRDPGKLRPITDYVKKYKIA